jgi:phage gpG-like protein
MAKSSITYKIDLRDFTDNPSKDLAEEVGEFLRDKVLQYASEAKSPVSGGGWKKTLSPKYKALKKEESGSTIANLELFGDMLDALDIKTTKNTVEIGIWDKEQAQKLDGHGHYGVFGENKYLPERRLLPDSKQTFKREIIKDMKEIIKEYGDS